MGSAPQGDADALGLSSLAYGEDALNSAHASVTAARILCRWPVNPDVFITVAFATIVVLFAIPAVVVMVRMVRRQRRTDSSSNPSATAQVPCAAVVRAIAASDRRKGVR